MKSLKGTKTLENLMKAFAGESQARNRYSFYASAAAKEGFKQIESIFIETADNEKEHAKRFYKLLLEGLNEELPTGVVINAEYPVAQGSTLDNLLAAAAGENEEWTVLYKEFGLEAEKEGFPEAAAAFRLIGKVEEKHEKRYRKLAANIQNGMVFRKDGATLWKCRNCGYVHEGTGAPEQCPACQHPQAYFEVLAENY